MRILLLSVLFAAIPRTASAERVAVMSAGGSDTVNLVPLVTVSLAESGLELVDQARLTQLLREDELSAAFAPDGSTPRQAGPSSKRTCWFSSARRRALRRNYR